jgi:hypothetical protein
VDSEVIRTLRDPIAIRLKVGASNPLLFVKVSVLGAGDIPLAIGSGNGQIEIGTGCILI